MTDSTTLSHRQLPQQRTFNFEAPAAGKARRDWKRGIRTDIIRKANGIPRSVRRLLMYLDSRCIDQAFCWPSRRDIASHLGYEHLTSVSDVIRKAIDGGWLDVQERYRPDGTRRSNVYKILYAALQRTYLPKRAPTIAKPRRARSANADPTVGVCLRSPSANADGLRPHTPTPLNKGKESLTNRTEGAATGPPADAAELREEMAALVDAWNAIDGVTHCSDVTPARRRKLRTRLQDAAWRDHWRDALAVVARSTFLRGGGPRRWRADFDWLLQPDSLTKIREGKYDDGKPTTARTGPGQVYSGDSGSGESPF